MHIIVAFPDISAYVDRILMYAELSKLVDSFHLLSRPTFDPQIFDGRTANITFHLIDNMDAWGFQLASFQRAKAIIAQYSTPGSRFIVQDVFRGRLALFFRFLPYFKQRHNLKNVVALYSPSAHFLLDRKWMKTGKPRVSLAEHWFYAKLYGSRVAVEWLSAHTADGIICNSDDIADAVRRIYRASCRLAVINTAIDCAHIPTVPKVERSALRFPDKPLLLFVGRAHGVKGTYLLLETLRILRQRQLAFHMVFVGQILDYDVNDINELLNDYNLRDYVTLVGPLKFEDLPLYYSVANIMLLPSLAEGSPRVVKEAMLYECPVIASDISGIRMIDPNLNSLTVVNVGDANAFADAVEAMLQRPELAAKKGKLGRQLVLQHFSPKEIAHDVRSFYLSLFE